MVVASGVIVLHQSKLEEVEVGWMVIKKGEMILDVSGRINHRVLKTIPLFSKYYTYKTCPINQ